MTANFIHYVKEYQPRIGCHQSKASSTRAIGKPSKEREWACPSRKELRNSAYFQRWVCGPSEENQDRQELVRIQKLAMRKKSNRPITMAQLNS